MAKAFPGRERSLKNCWSLGISGWEWISASRFYPAASLAKGQRLSLILISFGVFQAHRRLSVGLEGFCSFFRQGVLHSNGQYTLTSESFSELRPARISKIVLVDGVVHGDRLHGH